MTPTPDSGPALPPVAAVAESLTSLAGGYLRNSLVLPGVTCHVCRGPVPAGEPRCPQCRDQHEQYPGRLSDRVAVYSYAPSDGQAARAMRGYKSAWVSKENQALVILMCHVAVRGHMNCPGYLAGEHTTHWATVPSLSGRQGEHPLRVILRNIAVPGREVKLEPNTAIVKPRDVNPDAFTADASTAHGRHVILVDDTWARGGHAQSAAYALKAAGATKVSTLILARWLKMDWPDHATFRRTHLASDFDTGLCPWTGGRCPTRPDGM